MLQALCQADFKLLRPLCAWAEGPSAKDPALKAALLCHQTRHGFKRWQKGKTFRLCVSSAWLFAQGLVLELWWISVGLPREARHYPTGTAASKTCLPSVCPEWWSTLLQNTHRHYVANSLSLMFVFLFFFFPLPFWDKRMGKPTFQLQDFCPFFQKRISAKNTAAKYVVNMTTNNHLNSCLLLHRRHIY